jgi:hypothetical protein
MIINCADELYDHSNVGILTNPFIQWRLLTIWSFLTWCCSPADVCTLYGIEFWKTFIFSTSFSVYSVRLLPII